MNYEAKYIIIVHFDSLLIGFIIIWTNLRSIIKYFLCVCVCVCVCVWCVYIEK